MHLIITSSQGNDKLVSFSGNLFSVLIEGIDALLEGNLKALDVLLILLKLVIQVLDLFILLKESFLLCFAFSG